MKNSKGFTLLEVLVAVAILAILSFYTAQSIQKAVQSKVKIQGDIERTSGLRDGIKIIARDVETAFNYRDPNIELQNKAGKEREKRAQTNKSKSKGKKTPGDNDDSVADTDSLNKPFEPRPVVIVTHFIGDAESMHFTSLNNFRGQADQATSDQMEVGYFLRSCRNRMSPEKSSNCLIRRTSSIIDDDVTKDGEEVALIENVTRFELRYMGYQENVDWQTTWRSDSGGDDITKNHFPLAVEITLETKDATKEKGKTTAMTLVAEIRNPNNPVPVAPAVPGVDGQELPQDPTDTGEPAGDQ